MEGHVEYNTSLFEAATIQRLIGHYRRLLNNIVAAPHAPIHSLEILTPEELRMLLQDFNATEAFVPEKTLTCLVEEQVERTPHATAVRYESDSLSYSKLNQRANQLGNHLRKLGVGPEKAVAVCLERS